MHESLCGGQRTAVKSCFPHSTNWAQVVRLGLCHLTGSSCLFLCSLRSKNVSYNFWCLEKNEASCFKLEIKWILMFSWIRAMFISFVLSTFELQYQTQSWIAAVEMIWPAKPKIITVWLWIENVGLPILFPLLFNKQCCSVAMQNVLEISHTKIRWN